MAIPDCMICGASPAPFRQGWPGLKESQPAAIRGLSMRLCAFNGRCHAITILRAEAKTRKPWPFRHGQDALRALVEEIRPEFQKDQTS